MAQADVILKGNQLYRAGQYQQAEIQYRKALEASPKRYGSAIQPGQCPV
jgi:tetratricopeptide (TPR) repeat protein